MESTHFEAAIIYMYNRVSQEFGKEFVTSLLVPLMSFLQEVRVELIGTIFPEEKIIGAENQGPGKVTLQLSAKWRNGKGISQLHLAVGERFLSIF